MQHNETTPSVFFVTPWERKGGSATYAQYLMDHLENLTEVEIYPWDQESLLGRGSGIDAFSLDFLRGVYCHDVVHVQYHFGLYLLSFPFILLLCTLLRTPVVMTQHGRFGDLPFSRTIYWYHQIVMFGVDRVLVHSGERKEMIWSPHQSRTETIPHGIIHRPEVEREPRNAHRLLMPGIIRPTKGYDIAIEALSKLPDDYELRIAGPMPDSERYGEEYYVELTKLAEELGVADQLSWEIGFLPEEELFEEYEKADIILLPYEENAAISGILGHAISWKVPVLVSKAPVFEETVPCDEAFFSPRDSDALAEGIDRLANSPSEQQNIIDTFEKLSTDWSWRSVAEQTVEIYESTSQLQRK